MNQKKLKEKSYLLTTQKMKLSEIKDKIPIRLYNSLESQGIEELRPSQEKAISKGLLDKKNILVCTPTASGKTLLSMLGAVKTQQETNGKIVYVVPLKALATEKYHEFKQNYSFLKTGISIGDKDSADHYLGEYDLIICTSEKLDSLIRNNASWLNQISVIILDEIHLLNDISRGPTLEVTVTLLRKMLPQIQIIALSATIGNPKDLAEWLNAELVEDDWRPVKLYQGVIWDSKIDFYNQKDSLVIKNKTDDGVINLALDPLEKEKQALIFCKTKREAESLAEKISKETSYELNEKAEEILKVLESPTKQCLRLAKIFKKGIAFHHSGLASKQRFLVENEFKKNNIKIICCTPSLAMGINLPAFRTIIKDLKRYEKSWGLQWIPVLEYQQFSGRAGRPGYGDYGEAIVVSKNEDDKNEIYQRYLLGEVEPIQSKLASEVMLRMHVLSLFSSGVVKTEEELLGFFEQTFLGSQMDDLYHLEMLLDKVIKLLIKFEFVEEFEGNLRVTLLGKRVSQLYLDPLTANHLVQCINNSSSNEITDFGLLQTISNTLEMNLNYNIKNQFEIERKIFNQVFLQNVPSQFEIEYESFLASCQLAMMFEDWIKEKTEDQMMEDYKITPGELNYRLENADWLLYSFHELAKLLECQGLLVPLSKLRFRMKYGVKEELLELLKLSGVGKIRARKMYAQNIKTLKDVKEVKINILGAIIGDKVASNLKEQLGIKVGQQKLTL